MKIQKRKYFHAGILFTNKHYILEPLTQEKTYSFLQGGGEMGALTRCYDWGFSSLGVPPEWPQSLRTTVSNLLRSKFPMLLWWGDDMIQFYNDAYRPSMGNEGKHPAALGKKGRECWPEIWHIIYPLIEQVRLTGDAIWMEDQLIPIYRNGKIEDVYWTYSYSSVLDDAGGHGGILVTCTETTHKVNNLRELKKSESNLHNMILQAPVAMCILQGPEYTVQIANNCMLDFWGCTAGEMLYKPLFESLPIAVIRGIDELLAGVLKTGESFSAGEVPVSLLRNGIAENFFINFTFEPIREAGGTVSGILAMATDVTVQVNARRKTEEAEEKSRLSLEASNLGSFEVNLITGEMSASPRFDAIFGVNNSTSHGNYIQSIHPDDLPLRERAYQQAFKTGLLEYEARLLWNDNSVHWVRVWGNVTFDHTHQPFKLLGVAQDNTERRQAEDALRYTAERLELALQAGKLGSYELWVNSGRIDCTAACKQSYGLQPSDELDFDRLISLILPADRQGLQAAVKESVEQKTPLSAEYRIHGPEGNKSRWIRVAGIPIYTPQGQPEKIVGITVDITEQKEFAEELGKQVRERTLELEEKNKELERSNANLEEFAYAASHDLKEPIRKIHYFTARLKDQLSGRLSAAESALFTPIERSTQRMNELIDDLLQYSHVSQRPHKKEMVDLNLKLKLILEDLEVDIREKNAVIHIGNLPWVNGYRRQLQQLFHNLITNALKYSKPDIPPQIVISSLLVPGSSTAEAYHRIEFRDNGIGFEQEYAEKIFHMFTRLHGRNEYSGTGVGLSIAKKVVENHNGYISATGVTGEGAVFCIHLPAAEGFSY